MKKSTIVIIAIVVAIAGFVYWKMKGFGKAIDEAVEAIPEND
jgi:FlaG/FlaF family flagellin (archaellin)